MATNVGRFIRQELHVDAEADANGVELLCGLPQEGYAGGAFQVTGTLTTSVVYFECTLDGTNWVALECAEADDSSTVVTQTSTTGVFRFTALGLYKVRARLDHDSTDVVTVWGSLIG